MTVDDLLAETVRIRSGPIGDDALLPSNISEFLRFALGHLLQDIDYEADPRSGGAIAARVMAVIITGADETAARGLQ